MHRRSPSVGLYDAETGPLVADADAAQAPLDLRGHPVGRAVSPSLDQVPLVEEQRGCTAPLPHQRQDVRVLVGQSLKVIPDSLELSPFFGRKVDGNFGNFIKEITIDFVTYDPLPKCSPKIFIVDGVPQPEDTTGNST